MFLFTLFSNFSVNFTFFLTFHSSKAGHQIHHLHNVVFLNDDSVARGSYDHDDLGIG